MNYELAKKLKDAGFPQNPNKEYERRNSWVDSSGKYTDFQTGIDDTECYIPTLSELIEACGTTYRDLYEIGIVCHQGKWFATYTDEYAQVPDELSFSGYDTPEEAVANLWLALNKK